MNCYICGGFLLSKDKHTAGKKTVHRNCWGRLDRKQERIIEETYTVKSKKELIPLDNYPYRRIFLD